MHMRLQGQSRATRLADINSLKTRDLCGHSRVAGARSGEPKCFDSNPMVSLRPRWLAGLSLLNGFRRRQEAVDEAGIEAAGLEIGVG